MSRIIEGKIPTIKERNKKVRTLMSLTSDGRYKFNVQENVKGLDFILQLRPVTYQFDVKRFDVQMSRQANTNNADGSNNYAINYAMQTAYDEATRIRRSGFIAQEVEKAASEAGYDFSGLIKPKTDQDHYSLSYDAFVVPLVKAIQEQEQVILTQNQRIAGLEKELAEIKKLLQSSH